MTSGLTTDPVVGYACRAIYEIDSLRAISESRVFGNRRCKPNLRPGKRLTSGFEFRSLYGGVEIDIDCGAVDDFRNLIACIIIVKYVAVQGQRAVEQAVFAA